MMNFLDTADIVWRFLAAFCAGGLMSVAGSSVQIVTQNELAGPSTVGFNAYCVILILLAQACIVFFPSLPALEYTSFMLFVLVTAVILLIVRQKKRETSKVRYSSKLQSNISLVLLIGLCFNLFSGAIFSLMQFAFMALNLDFPTQLWFGNFRFVQVSAVAFLLPYFFFIYLALAKLVKKLVPISFGGDFSAGLGINVSQIQAQTLLLALMAVGVVNCFYGIFSFFGLLAPHILRTMPLFRYSVKRELLLGSFLAAFIFALLDLFAREFIFLGVEIPVGMLSALLGSFVLMYILLRNFFS